jgi:hypothetical protein
MGRGLSRRSGAENKVFLLLFLQKKKNLLFLKKKKQKNFGPCVGREDACSGRPGAKRVPGASWMRRGSWLSG